MLESPGGCSDLTEAGWGWMGERSREDVRMVGDKYFCATAGCWVFLTAVWESFVVVALFSIDLLANVVVQQGQGHDSWPLSVFYSCL